jgi:formate dehydrogenase major subunit
MADRPDLFRRLRDLPVVGRAADWGLGPSAVPKNTKRAGSRIAGLKATESVCPYCAVGCGQIVYTREGELVDIEGNPRSPINQGTLCPKGAACRYAAAAASRCCGIRRHRSSSRDVLRPN